MAIAVEKLLNTTDIFPLMIWMTNKLAVTPMAYSASNRKKTAKIEYQMWY
jgi:hypothetical protein